VKKPIASKNDTPSTLPLVRCAVYTRKSSKEGLEQEFNSLDAEGESAEAFIRSQQHEGWRLLPEYYDDGRFTGGNMELPPRNGSWETSRRDEWTVWWCKRDAGHGTNSPHACMARREELHATNRQSPRMRPSIRPITRRELLDLLACNAIQGDGCSGLNLGAGVIEQFLH